MQPASSLDRAGSGDRRPTTLASFHQGRAPHNKGLRYPPDPPTPEEIILVMRAAGHDVDGVELRALIVLWRAGLRIGEALALADPTLIQVAARFSCAKAKAGNAGRSGWTAGRGSSCSYGSSCAKHCRSVRSSSSTEPRAAAGADCHTL